MLWVISVVFFLIGVLKLSYSNTKKKLLISAIGVIAIELLLCLTLVWCFTSPIKGELINCKDITDATISVTADTVSVINRTSEFSYSYRDSLVGYTTCTESSTSCVYVYQEKFSTLKLLLSFKQPQGIVEIYFNNTNKIR